MWKTVSIDKSGNWTEHGIFDSVLECKNQSEKLTEKPERLFYFWADKMPFDNSSKDKIIKEVFEANDGKVLRLTIGLEIKNSSNKELLDSCGNCFCTIYQNGVRQCEGKYCNEFGYCWWVVCGGTC